MERNYEKLKNILSEMFQFDQSDLDFGIYRIMNHKREEIEKFLNIDLLPQVKQQLEIYSSSEGKAVEEELEEVKKKLDELEIVYEDNAKYMKLKSKLDNAFNLEDAQNEVYSHLANFFSRYYKDGDFISLRRYKKDVYAIPYEGEEVKLHWANSDQYYIKTSEYFKDYSFKLENGKEVCFKLVEAETEQNNKKEQEGKERRFIIYKEEPVIISSNQLVIQFEYKIDKDKQNKLVDEAIETISQHLNENEELTAFKQLLSSSPTEKNKKRILLEKYLNDYVSRNTFDYFIHKDLGGFLRRELDFYIKNEIMFLDDINTENEVSFEKYLAKIKVIKNIGEKIITFLAQIEEFQKKLWLKKKFIYDTNYCLTLDKVPERLYYKILENKEQVEEWIKLFAIDEIKGDLANTPYTEPLTIEFLKENPYLVLDTVFFDEDFKDKIIERIDNLDENIDGLMIHSENFQALNLLQERYNEQIKCCYIDPPYNTNASKIIYKNGYEHSSWISLINDRLIYARKLISEDGIIEVAIDDYELRHLNLLMSQVFGINNFISNIAILTNPKGRDQEFIAQAHDYNVLYAKNKSVAKTYDFLLSEEEMLKKYPLEDENNDFYRELPLKRTGSEKFREDRPFMFFPFIYDRKSAKLDVLPEGEYLNIYNKIINKFNDEYLLSLKKDYEYKGYEFILPVDEGGNYLRWRWGYDSCKNGVKEGTIFAKKTQKNTINIYEKNMGENFVTPKSLWYGERYDASSKGTNLLKNMINNNVFDYPKSLFTVIDSLRIGSDKSSIIIDFFGGSGTTAHATIELNRSDKSKRKYILVEMGEHFNTVTKPRIQKAIYSKDWKNGKPVSREGISHIFKYFRLESYEDTLNNLDVNLNEQQLKTLEKSQDLKEKYMLSYMLEKETEESMSLLNIDNFKNPFDYQLKINKNLETRNTKMDLVETFNYLLGLVVDSIEKKEYFNTEFNEDKIKLQNSEKHNSEYLFKKVEGKTLDGEKVLIIWRTMTDDIAKDNLVLDAYFEKKRYNANDFEYDKIYVNGDNNLPNMKLDEDMWKVILIEEEFKKRMFDIQDI